MKRLLNICLLLTFLMGYLEWGKEKSMFIFEGEADIFSRSLSDPGAFLHPFILVPLCGQIMLLVTVFQKRPGRILTLAGLACLSSIMLFLFFIGLITPSIKIAGFVIPFLVTGIFVLQYNRKRQS